MPKARNQRLTLWKKQLGSCPIVLCRGQQLTPGPNHRFGVSPLFRHCQRGPHRWEHLWHRIETKDKQLKKISKESTSTQGLLILKIELPVILPAKRVYLGPAENCNSAQGMAERQARGRTKARRLSERLGKVGVVLTRKPLEETGRPTCPGCSLAEL